MTKATRARYTLEFKQEAVRLVEGGQSQAAVAKTLGLVEQTTLAARLANGWLRRDLQRWYRS
jgi:transposase-like protein